MNLTYGQALLDLGWLLTIATVVLLTWNAGTNRDPALDAKRAKRSRLLDWLEREPFDLDAADECRDQRNTH